MNKCNIMLILILLLNNCTNNDKTDIFSEEKNYFSILEINEKKEQNNKYFMTNIGISFSPPINSIELSENEKNRVIESTPNIKELFTIDNIFISEKDQITTLVAYMETNKNKLNSFINYLENINNNTKLEAEYYKINGIKNIQFRFNIQNKIYMLYTIFEATNNYYLILNYTFQKSTNIEKLHNSSQMIIDSLSTIKF